MADSYLSDQLYKAWNQAVAADKLINQFEASEDDPDGQWQRGDAIAFGVKKEGDRHTYYAQNLTQSREIQGAVEEKQIDNIGFICQFNGYRALRPGGHRRSLGRQPDISPDPQRCRFFCQDSSHSLSLLTRKPLLQVSLQHFTWNAYYNVAPIDPDGHCLWVPTAKDSSTLSHFPQKLSLPFLEDAFSLFKQLTHTLLFFNALHSGASVNHIHFQAMDHKQPLPVEVWPLLEQPLVKSQDCALPDYALLKGYPAQVMVFNRDTPAHKVFLWIDRLQQRNIPFNLMLVGQRIVLIPRNIEHEIVSEFPGNGIAALGMCGKIITIDRAAYLQADETSIKRAFQKMVLPVGRSDAPTPFLQSGQSPDAEHFR